MGINIRRKNNLTMYCKLMLFTSPCTTFMTKTISFNTFISKCTMIMIESVIYAMILDCACAYRTGRGNAHVRACVKCALERQLQDPENWRVECRQNEGLLASFCDDTCSFNILNQLCQIARYGAYRRRYVNLMIMKNRY